MFNFIQHVCQNPSRRSNRKKIDDPFMGANGSPLQDVLICQRIPQSEDGRPTESCWVVLDRIIAVTRFNFYGDDRVTVRLWDYTNSCGYSLQVHEELYSIGNRARRNFLEAACRISFVSGKHDHTLKQLIITVGGIAASFIPGKWLTSLTQTDITGVPPQTPHIAEHAQSLVALVTGTAPGSTLSTTSRRDAAQRFYREMCTPAVEQIIESLSVQAANKRVEAGQFAVVVLQKAVADLANGVTLESPEQALDRKVVENLRQFFQCVKSNGPHPLQVHLAQSTVLSALVGVQGTGHPLTIREVQSHFQINWHSTLRKVQDINLQRSTLPANQNSLLGVLATVTHREKRNDEVDQTFARDFWHISCRTDTFNKRKVTVEKGSAE
jgi:hypothetical protein